LFNEKVRARVADKGQFRKRIVHSYYRDLLSLEKLDYDKRFSPSQHLVFIGNVILLMLGSSARLKRQLGVNRLRNYLLEITWRRHKELIPQIPTLIQTLKDQTLKRKVGGKKMGHSRSLLTIFQATVEAQLAAVLEELERDAEGRRMKMRYICSKYMNEFHGCVFTSLESKFPALFNNSKSGHYGEDPPLAYPPQPCQTSNTSPIASLQPFQKMIMTTHASKIPSKQTRISAGTVPYGTAASAQVGHSYVDFFPSFASMLKD